MKLLTYMFALCLPVFMLVACDSDLEKVTYNEENGKAATLSGVGTSYVLDSQKGTDVVINFQWTQPEVGYSAEITTKLQMDLKGKNFAGKGLVALTSMKVEHSYKITTEELNKALLKLLKNYEMDVAPVDVDFRLISTIASNATSLYSNVMSVNITPFEGEIEYPQVYLVGAYSDWANPDNSFANCQHLYSVKSDDMYEGWIVFGTKAAEGWKITPEATWDKDWSYDGELAAGATSVTLATGKENMTCFTGFSYKFSFNTTTLELKILASVKSWGIVGGHNNWGNDTPAVPDAAMTLATEKDQSGKVQSFLTATVEMAAGNTWKIRPDNKWSNDIGSGAVDGEFEVDGSNFKVSESGTYTIKWYFNKVKGKVVVTKQ